MAERADVPFQSGTASGSVDPWRWTAVARAADRRPALLVVLLAVAAAALANRSGGPTDYVLFAKTGVALLHGDTTVFNNPQIQTGPLSLVLMGLLHLISTALGPFVDWFVLMALCALTAGCLVSAIRIAVPTPGERRGALTLVAVVTALALRTLSFDDAHPSHPLIGLLWFLAARAARRDRPVLVGLLLAAAAGLDSWAVLGSGLLLLLPTARARAKAAAVAGVLAGACWAPFALSGSFHMFQMRWLAAKGALPALLFGPVPVPWSYRVLQAAVVVAAGAAVAVLHGRDDDVAWLLPAVVVGTRIALDPLNFPYYATPLVTMLLVGLAVCAMRTKVLDPRSADPVRGQLGPWVLLIPALLLPPVTGLLGGPPAAYGPAVVCMAGFTVLTRQGRPARVLHRWHGSP
jgi:hypothetical protein